ncbi:nuclear transport factor 2 family protein [Sorangium sp. So ce1335]|uniref:nuclear transport factor 2 family protein n=1 Tax=Sorangium sp. So ce1335 TaxID=3133335 RepID=UPI003F606EBA
MSTNSGGFSSFLRRVLPIVSTLALAGAVTVTLTRPAEGTVSNGVPELKALQEIEQLEYCYAAGTDAIGRGDLATGKQIFSKCFTPNAPVLIWEAGAAPGDPPVVSVPSAEAWADFMAVLFAESGYVDTQHLISNVRIDILPGGNRAKITSYLIATHVYDPLSSVQVAHGTYENEAVWTPSGWKLSKRTFRTKAFMRIDSPEP